uniref:DNA helicase n=1 Tax=Parastrongyloides trichosuri TaxID=131310 RepID=A0A0N4ZE72_PARTI
MNKAIKAFKTMFNGEPSPKQLKVLSNGLIHKRDIMITGSCGKGKTISAILLSLLLMCNDATVERSESTVSNGEHKMNEKEKIISKARMIYLTTDVLEMRGLVNSIKYVKSVLEIEGSILEITDDSPLTKFDMVENCVIIVSLASDFLKATSNIMFPFLKSLTIDSCPPIANQTFSDDFKDFASYNVMNDKWNVVVIGRKIRGNTYSVMKELLMKKFAVVSFNDEEMEEKPKYLKRKFKG